MTNAATQKTNDRTQPQDHKPKSTLKVATLDRIEVQFKGETYLITRDRMDNLEIFELVEDEKAISAVREFLGPEQWGRYKESNRVDGRVSLTDFNDFLNQIMAAIGGNSSASAGS